MQRKIPSFLNIHNSWVAVWLCCSNLGFIPLKLHRVLMFSSCITRRMYTASGLGVSGRNSSRRRILSPMTSVFVVASVSASTSCCFSTHSYSPGKTSIAKRIILQKSSGPSLFRGANHQLRSIDHSSSNHLHMAAGKSRKRDSSSSTGGDMATTAAAQERQNLLQEYASSYHAPVMPFECLHSLLGPDYMLDDQREPNTNRIFVDATLGGGGHSLLLLSHLREGDLVIGVDVDSDALSAASARLKDYMVTAEKGIDQQGPQFATLQCNFGEIHHDIPRLLKELGRISEEEYDKDDSIRGKSGGGYVDGILMDLGVSSHQIDTPQRGFAFMENGPLDMRMGGKESHNENALSAADICNEFDLYSLVDIFRKYGDEPRAKKIAESIINSRPLGTTSQLREAIAAVTPQFHKKKRLGLTATCARVFQSLRIVVNDEEQMLRQALEDGCPQFIKQGGRLVVISYHSLEDRITKRVMKFGSLENAEKRKSGGGRRDMYGNIKSDPSTENPWKLVGKKGQKATKEEVELNSRSRSATLRVAERC
uniref:Uncharacterized protein n=1 Tax=Proboscia inermis TaxID=420281 RepID=A0A7S0G9L4_9STRA|mmetsp:Transcript_15500/g.15700  ORF Transcript_15500/g.15700 Transcript_15500/m.15700 type:complete len:538 (+) Transcript_15500:92-1705(+)